MRVSKIGEFGLIKRIKESIRTDSSVIHGIGDDCAVLPFDAKRYLLYTCDMLVEGVDFKTSEDFCLVGRKALAVSLSDIASCGGLARYCLVSLGIPRGINVKSIDQIYEGMTALTNRYGVNIVGGDISRVEGKIVIDVSVLGFVEKECLVLRNGACIGDIIFVTGKLGGSILSKHLTFKPRIKEARFLVKNFRINSMIDISDGLTQDLHHILEESKVGAVIYKELIPLNKTALSFNEAISSGEDFELLFTLPSREANRLALRKNKIFTSIGQITNKSPGLSLIKKDGCEERIKPAGFRHF